MSNHMKKIASFHEKGKFESFLDQKGGCWLWKGKVSDDGIPLYETQGYTYRAARWALEVYGRRGPCKNVKIETTCGNVLCVRPLHQKITKLARR